MKLRRLAALVSATVLALGMVSAVTAHQNEPQWACGEPGKPACEQPSTEPSQEPSSEPSQDASTEPSQDASVEPSTDASLPDCSNEQGQPTVCPPTDGQVEGLTSNPTLPPTDAIASNSTSAPDGTLPLVLIVLGVIGLAAVVITPVRAKR